MAVSSFHREAFRFHDFPFSGAWSKKTQDATHRGSLHELRNTANVTVYTSLTEMVLLNGVQKSEYGRVTEYHYHDFGLAWFIREQGGSVADAF